MTLSCYHCLWVCVYPAQCCKPFEDRDSQDCFPTSLWRWALQVVYGQSLNIYRVNKWTDAWTWLKLSSDLECWNSAFPFACEEAPFCGFFSRFPGVLFDPHKDLLTQLGGSVPLANQNKSPRTCGWSRFLMGSQFLYKGEFGRSALSSLTQTKCSSPYAWSHSKELQLGGKELWNRPRLTSQGIGGREWVRKMAVTRSLFLAW